ncbi:DNA cytosine methyltransferase [Pseudomonas lactis]|uniref:DNA (cytosine-5-)-methyltransferase n=1 Tax=Pseudomonas lactis TaxID=1615674 RepID=I4K4B7_9PSED|nr:DNA cytosine methyltransferase [Pseudomonas lactis]EIK59557.1 DNA (cytosine-5-)-methyltransferase [Pseudomonas lactis]
MDTSVGNTATVKNKTEGSGLSSDSHKVVSLFCGAGGLDLGFINAGFEVCFAADYDAAAIKTYNKNHPGGLGRVVDLLDTTVDQLCKSLVESCGEDLKVSGIIGGPPCQGFSRGNVGRHADDPRNQLALKYADIVNSFYHKFGLKFFVFENVPEIRAQKNKDFLEGLRSELSLNFDIYEKELNASNYQVAQARRRLFIVGVCKSLGAGEFVFPAPSPLKVKVVRDVISDLPEPVYLSSNLVAESIPYHQNHWTSRPKSKRFETGIMPVGGRSFIQLDWTKPSRTVAYGNREIHVHPNGKRRLSIYEALQLQGFPFKYVLEGNMSQQVKQVSNAVPPPVAEKIAESIMEQIL